MAVYDLTEKVCNFRFGTWRGREITIMITNVYVRLSHIMKITYLLTYLLTY